jgi:hypothetical protein
VRVHERAVRRVPAIVVGRATAVGEHDHRCGVWLIDGGHDEAVGGQLLGLKRLNLAIAALDAHQHDQRDVAELHGVSARGTSDRMQGKRFVDRMRCNRGR